jgi:hypothetical protein
MSNVNPAAARLMARDVAELIVNNPEPTSRSELNRHFKTTSNIPANDRLTLAILNLMEHGYLNKCFSMATSTASVNYWPTQKLADFFGVQLKDYEGTPESVSRKSGYPDFLTNEDDASKSTQETAETEAAPADVGIAPDWCPVKDFLATEYNNNVRADYRARAVLVYLAMRQHWEQTKVVDELNKLMRPYLVKRAIDTLLDKKVIEVGLLVARHGNFSMLRVVDQDFVAKVHQVEPPPMHDVRLLAQPEPTPLTDVPTSVPAPEPSDETLKVARLIAALPKDDQDLVIALVTRLAISK